MKKLTRVLCAVFVAAMMVSCLCLPASAVTVDWNSVKLESLIDIMNSYVETSDELLDQGQYCMRGFAVSPDGRFAFGGFLNPNSAAALNIIDLETARPGSSYVHEQTEGGRGYPKGIAVDDRNHVYVGEAYYQNYGSVNYAILTYNEKGELTEEGFYNVVTEGTPGDKNGTKMGVNGVDILKLDGKYYMYLVVNYDMDRLYRFDVTDVKNPTLDTTFGTNGYVDLNAVHNFKEGQYLDVDVDGTIYIGATLNDGESGLYVLSADGKTMLNSAKCTKGYAVAIWEDFVFVSTQSGPTCINVIDKVTMNQVATLACHDGANSYVYITVVNNVLYVADQGSGAADYDSIVVAPLSDAGKKIITDRKAAYAAALETSASETTTPAPTPDNPTTTPTDTTTEKPSETTPTPTKDTSTPAPTQNTTTEKPADPKGGCGSVVALGLMACVIPAAVVVAKKKKD